MYPLLASREQGLAPRMVVVSGSVTADLPELPAGLELVPVAFDSTAEGDAFLIGEVRGALQIHRWRPGIPQGVTRWFPGLGVTHPVKEQRWPILIRSANEVYVTATSRNPSGPSTTVLRFDGSTWNVSRSFPDTDGLSAQAWTPDGAVWLVLESAKRGASSRQEVWRREPGATDRWARVASAGVDIGPLRIQTIMALEDSDVVMLASEGSGATERQVLYRMHLPARSSTR